jgi:hypothetical protein
VLKEDGVFCITDFRKRKLFKDLEEDLESSDLKIVNKVDITKNIILSLKFDEKRKIDLIEGMVGKSNSVWSLFIVLVLWPIAKKFSGVEGSRINDEFYDRTPEGTGYMIYVLKRKSD